MRGKTLILFVAGAIAVCASAQPAAAGPVKAVQADARIQVHDNFFDPRSVSIERGDTVKWVWKGANRHNVVFKRLSPGTTPKRRIKARKAGQAVRVFDTPGMYRYTCTVYGSMEGTLDVAP